MSRNFFKKSFLASLSALSILNSSNAQEEIIMGKKRYDNLGENDEVYTPEGKENSSNENRLSFVQRHPKKSIAFGFVGGAMLKQPIKDILWGGYYSLFFKPRAKTQNRLNYEKIFGKIEDPQYVQLQEGMGWCANASFQANLKSLGINISQENVYRLLHTFKFYSNGQLYESTLEPAFFEGNRMNTTVIITDGYEFGQANGNYLNSIAKEFKETITKELKKANNDLTNEDLTKFKKISENLTGANFLVLNEDDQKMTPELLERIVRDVASKMKGWFCISDPITFDMYGAGHAIICKLEGDTLYFENPNIPGAYQMNIKKWCEMSSEIINKSIIVCRSTKHPDIFFQAFGFTCEKIKSQIIYTLTNNGGLDIYEH